MNTICERKTLMKLCLVCEISKKQFASQLDLPKLYKFLCTKLHSMLAAAHDLLKGRREVKDHASIFIFHQL